MDIAETEIYNLGTLEINVNILSVIINLVEM